MKARELRKKFLDFFRAKGHAIIPSASLVPSETDPTALFTTAGMHPFKQYYLKPNETEISRAATIQKCVRTVDIEEVGDETHLTFFEMLGNFSFGYPNKKNSYFKREALRYAWDFLTGEMNIDKSRICATYFQGGKEAAEDKESLKILKELDGLNKVKPQGAKDNFWSLGMEGSPGGPTVEFYVDGIEIWNCVFNEYVLKSGRYEPLKNKGVDTGMGLERMLAVLNGLDNVYETELFAPIIENLETQISKRETANQNSKAELNDVKSIRVIADHIKTSVFIISDGVVPSNVGKGYILRRLIRRAVRHGKILGIENDFTKPIAETVIDIYKETYPEIEENKNKIFEELEKEEEKFRKTLERGLKIIKNYELRIKNDGENVNGKEIFDLYQSYGFPIEMSLEELEKRGVKFSKDELRKGFDAELKKHRELSRTAAMGKFKGGLADGGEKVKKLHTATHLLLAALRKVLGEHVYQKGSNITAERLRFDFSHPEKLSDEQKQKVEDLVNEIIKKNLPVTFKEVKLDEAKKSGAIGAFEAKYGEKVRVYTIGDSAQGGSPFSREICGGPHAERTGELGRFKIKKEQSSGAGVRRIKAVLIQ